MCMCKACVSCGGTPPISSRQGSCTSAVSVSLDVSGKFELVFDQWQEREEVLLLLTPGVFLKPVSTHGDLTFGSKMPTTQKTSSGAMELRLPISTSSDKGAAPSVLQYSYEGKAAKYLPKITCHLRALHPSMPPRPPLRAATRRPLYELL